MTVRFAPFRRGRFLIVGLVAAALLGLFLGWSTSPLRGASAFVIFALLVWVLLRWAVPSDLVRSVELTPQELIIHRASPTVSHIARGDIVAGSCVEDVLLLELSPGSVDDYPELAALGVVDGTQMRLPLAPADDEARRALDDVLEQVA